MKSWIESANTPQSHFPLRNLPFGVAKLADGTTVCVSAIGDFVVNLAMLEDIGAISAQEGKKVFNLPALNEFMALGKVVWQKVRRDLTSLFKEDVDSELTEGRSHIGQALCAISEVMLLMPFEVSEYTDFYAGMQHAENMGEILRGSASLPDNWLHIPVGYNGRASSVVVSGTDIIRPKGQTRAVGTDKPSFGPTGQLDLELELGAVIGTGSILGRSVSVSEAEEMIFGYVLLNDWSARDIQAWEYQPLGPFQGKAFATSISPWVVTTMALEEFRKPVPSRQLKQLPYLAEKKPGLYDITLEIFLQPHEAKNLTCLSQTNYSHMYYSSAQQLCHHSIGGCNMNCGDLLGSGTISGPTCNEFGSLMELSWGGTKPFLLDTGEKRLFIEDGDTVTLTGWAQGDGYRIGFGKCVGKVLQAQAIEN